MAHLNTIITHYKHWRQNNPDTLITYCENLDRLEDVILAAAKSKDRSGKRHNHQRRLKEIDLENFAETLLKKKETIELVRTFDELLYIIEECRVPGIGELTCYDTACRIGAKLNIEPQRIFMHAGTRKGAKKLLNRNIKEKFLDRKILPSPFHDKNLSDAEIEDILCIYKDQFEQIDLTKRKRGCC